MPETTSGGKKRGPKKGYKRGGNSSPEPLEGGKKRGPKKGSKKK